MVVCASITWKLGTVKYDCSYDIRINDDRILQCCHHCQFFKTYINEEK